MHAFTQFLNFFVSVHQLYDFNIGFLVYNPLQGVIFALNKLKYYDYRKERNYQW